MQCSWLTLSWKFGLDPMLQRNWTTSTCPYRAATWRAVSPDCNYRRTCQCNSLCHTTIYTACTLEAECPQSCIGYCSLSIAQPHNSNSRAYKLVVWDRHTTNWQGGYFFKGFLFPELIFLLYLFQIRATMGFLSNMRRKLCVQLCGNRCLISIHNNFHMLLPTLFIQI